MKKFLLTLAVVAMASSALMAQTNTTTQEEPDRIQMRHLSKNPTGNDIPTGYDAPQVKHECKDHKDGQPCTKPADQQCDDCKAKAAAAAKHECMEGMKECKEGMKHECKEGKKECKEGMKHECKEGKKECKEGMKHECKEGKKECKEGMKHECKEGMKECKEGMKHECKEGKKECKEGMKHECKDGMKHECKDHKDGQPCTKPADQQCPDCKEKAKKN
jgi:hypothetical protein